MLGARLEQLPRTISLSTDAVLTKHAVNKDFLELNFTGLATDGATLLKQDYPLLLPSSPARASCKQCCRFVTSMSHVRSFVDSLYIHYTLALQKNQYELEAKLEFNRCELTKSLM